MKNIDQFDDEFPRDVRQHHPDAVSSTSLRNPLVGMKMDELAAIYIRKLTGRLVFLELHNIQLRARLECATGEAWDSKDFVDMSADEIQNEVAESLVRGLGISKMDALKQVRENYETANPSLQKSPPQG